MTEAAKPKRKASFMELNANPFETKDTGGAKGTGLEAPTEFESLADTVKIERSDFENIVAQLEGEESNEMRIKTLHIMKTPYLFTSEQLISLLHITPSVKTRITFIEEIGPRLTDPKAKSTQIIELFRYSEEKRQVEEVLKARAQTVSKQSTFSRGKSQSVLSNGGGRGGRGAGGRGGGGRGAGGGRGMSKAASMDTMRNATPATPVGGGGRGAAGRGAGGRGAGGRGGRGSAVSTPTTSTANTPTPQTSPNPTTPTPSSSSLDSKEESKAEELPTPPVWAPPPRRESFVSNVDISQVKLPRKSMEPRKSLEVKPIAMKKRFSSRTSVLPSNSLQTIGDSLTEEISDGEEEGDSGDKEETEKTANDSVTTVKEKEQGGLEQDSTASSSSQPTPPISSLPTSAPVTTRSFKKKERRGSTFCATSSVMAALGFDDLQALTTDDIGRESWDIKADGGEDSKNVPTKEVAEKLKDLAVTTRAKEDKMSGILQDQDKDKTAGMNDDYDDDAIKAAANMRTEEDFRNDPNISQVKPSRVSLQELQERRRVVKVKTLWEKGITSGGNSGAKSVPNVEFKPLRVTSRRKSTRLIAEEERMMQYASSKEEGPIAVDEATGRNLYSYHELVRRNYMKSYGDVIQTELEEYLTEGEFFVRFNMSKTEFASLPRWRRVERKRALMLF